MRIKLSLILYSIVAACGFAPALQALTLEQIRQTPDLTPAKFAAYFSDFEFQFRAQIQSPEVFLATRSGDCDDYSTLAAEVLREKGFTPRLITVRMPKVVHVVCYIEETGSYLDYNNREKKGVLEKCGPSLEEIARSVAKSYQARWTSASEFTFSVGTKRLVSTVLPGKADKPRGLAGLFN